MNGVAATGEAVTLREHHSFIKLPDDGYTPRFADPRIGVNGPDVMDFAQPVDRDVVIRYASRFRLKKKNPSAARSEPVTPITYYVDPGIPEPIRSAVLEGTSWWNQAFEAAGYINAFRVAVLPAGADPDDIRYNMIHWSHRQTRGYSYGSTVEDPRTGEIIRGNVNLGSLRLRQDYLHGQGMVAPFDPLATAMATAMTRWTMRRPPTTSPQSPKTATRWRWRSPACGSWRRTRSATRSASPTTTSGVRRTARR